MKLNELKIQVDNLEKMITLVDDTVKFHITTLLAVGALVIALGALILPIIARAYALKAIENKMNSLQNNIRNDVLNDLGLQRGKGEITLGGTGHVAFKRAYDKPPIVTLSPLNKEATLYPIHVTSTSFSVICFDKKNERLLFNWIAVKDE